MTQLTEFNGIVITPELIAFVKSMQTDNNYMLKETQLVISQAVCTIVRLLDTDCNKEKDKALRLCKDLSLISDNFNSLAKP